MGLHLVFLAVYIFAGNALDAITLSLLFVAHCAIALLAEVRVSKKGLHMLSVYYIGASISTLANAFYLNKINTYGIQTTDIYFYILLEYVRPATSIWVIGNTMIFVGYEAFLNKGLPSIRVDIMNKKVISGTFRFILFIALLTLSGNSINLSGLTGGLQKVLSLLNLMGIMYYARLWVIENNVLYRNYSLILLTLQMIIALFTSFLRLDLLTPLVSFAGGYFIGKGSLKYVFSFRIVPLIAVFALFASIFNTLGGNRAHFITAFTEEQQQEEVQSSYTDLSQQGGRSGVFERSSNIAQLSNIVNLVEKNGTYNGKASVPLLAALIPRFLWPDKPQIQLGAWFALEIGAGSRTSSGTVNNSVNMSIPGQFYLDFGWIGLAIGCFFFGALLALFWNAGDFNQSAYNLPGALWGGYLLLYGIIGIGADLQIIVSLLSTYLVFLMIKKILNNYAGVLSRPTVAR